MSTVIVSKIEKSASLGGYAVTLSDGAFAVAGSDVYPTQEALMDAVKDGSVVEITTHSFALAQALGHLVGEDIIAGAKAELAKVGDVEVIYEA